MAIPREEVGDEWLRFGIADDKPVIAEGNVLAAGKGLSVKNGN